MGDAGTMSRQVYRGTVSTVHRDITDQRYRELRRPRKVRFFVNGDRYFRGKKLYITPHRYLNFNDLLGDLTGKLPSRTSLPYGVRQIFTPVAGHRVTDIEEMADGAAYVCGGFESFKPVRYGQDILEDWSYVGLPAKSPRRSDEGGEKQENFNPVEEALAQGRPHNHDFHGDYGYGEGGGYGGYGGGGGGRGGYYGNNGFRPGKQLRGSYPRKNGPPATFGHRDYMMHSDGSNARPKVITIVRNGPKPRSTVKMLLNRRSVQSFEQLMEDVADAFGPKWKNDKVRKLYTIKGRAIQSVSDFFRDDDVFIGVGNDKLTEGNVQDIIGELYPDNPYAQNLLKDYEKNNRRNKYTIKDPYEAENKKDSGLGDGEPSENEYIIYKGRPNFRDGHGRGMNDERGLAAKDERARAHRRRKKMLDAERRALEDERRKRGLVGRKEDPFKKMKEQKLREQREREDAKRRDDDDERRRREAEDAARNRKADDDKDRDDAERRARERQKAAEDEERRRKNADKDDDARRKAEKDAKDKDARAAKDKADRDREKADRDREAREREQREKEARDKAERDRQAAANKPKEKKARDHNMTTDDDVLKKYEQGRTLGDGNFAIVKQAKMKATGNEYAMKIIDKGKLKGKEQMVDNEIEIMKECAHPNIVKLYEDYETKDKIYLIEELVKGGDLFDAITQSVKFGERDSASMVKDLCSALFYLHARNIVHRDLKPENLLVLRNKDGSISLKLADFGLAMEVNEPIYTVCGTPTYVSPEILSEVGYGIEVDMWAVGVIAFILLCGFPPFRSADRKQTELFEFIKAGEYDFLSPYWDSISSTAKDLVEKLLVVNVQQRYTAIDVLCHPWIMGGGDLSEHNQDELKKLRDKGLELRNELNRENALAWENWQHRRS